MRRLAPSNLRMHARTLVWTLRAVLAARRQLREETLAPPRLAPVPPGPRLRGLGTVRHTLRATRVSCLTRSVVEQQWRAARGDVRDVVVGVRGGREAFSAHAWLEGSGDDDGHAEITRLRGVDLPGPG